MPHEKIQFARVDKRVNTETSVHWRREPAGYVQLSIQRYPVQEACPNGCDGVLTGCTSCPPPRRSATISASAPPKRLEGDVVDETEGGLATMLGTLDTSQGISDLAGAMATVLGLEKAPSVEILKDTVELAGVQPDGSAVMYSDELSRDDLNKLIRALRRARDQAYGQDA
jgi:hypothetical protein